MNKGFRVSIVSSEKTIYEGLVCSLIVPAELGYLGVWANHAPLIATLTPGKIIVKEKPHTEKVFYSHTKGFLEVIDNSATILTDSLSEAK